MNLKVLLIVLGIVVLGGASFLIIESLNDDPVPVISIEHDGIIYDGTPGSGCWEWKNERMCWTKSFPLSEETISVQEDTETKVLIEAKKQPQWLKAMIYNENQELTEEISLSPVLEAPFTITMDAGGIYYVIFTASWSEGSVNYGFKFDVMENSDKKPINEINSNISSDFLYQSQSEEVPNRYLLAENWEVYRNEEYGFEFKYPLEAGVYIHNQWHDGEVDSNRQPLRSGGGYFLDKEGRRFKFCASCHFLDF